MVVEVPRARSLTPAHTQRIAECVQRMWPVPSQQHKWPPGGKLQRKAFGSPVLCGLHSGVLALHGNRVWGMGIGRWQAAHKLQVSPADMHHRAECFSATAGVLGDELGHAMLIE